jgi:hypothetical protein
MTKNYKKIFTVGCSFSDRTRVTKSYGDYLAEELDRKYIHNAAGCGSNNRMWRTATNAIMNNELTSDDLLIVQYTEITRSEIWTASEQGGLATMVGNELVAPTGKVVVRDKFRHDGDIIRFKPGCSEWQPFEHEMQFIQQFEEQHVSPEFCIEQAIINNYNFQNMLHVQKIPTIFLQALRYGHELFDKNYFNFPEFRYSAQTLIDHNHALSKDDDYHINDAGHKWIATELARQIQRNKQ